MARVIVPKSSRKPKFVSRTPFGPLEDRFGVPFPSLLGYTVEEQAAHRRHLAELAADLFYSVVLHCGDADATKMWRAIAAKAKGRPTGSARPTDDRTLLGFYDKLCNPTEPEDMRVLPEHRVSFIAKLLAEQLPGRFGASADAVAKRLRRRLRKRDADHAREAGSMQQFRGGGGLFATLLTPSTPSVDDRDLKAGPLAPQEGQKTTPD